MCNDVKSYSLKTHFLDMFYRSERQPKERDFKLLKEEEDSCLRPLSDFHRQTLTSGLHIHLPPLADSKPFSFFLFSILFWFRNYKYY